jgi:hypothetical protein
MLSLNHGQGWQPPQTTSHIYIRHIQSVWSHWYAVHGHTVVALHSHTHTSWLSFWVLGHLWSQHVVIRSHWGWQPLKLLPSSILDIYKVLKHIHMLSMGIQYQPYTLIPSLLCSDAGFCVTCGVTMMSLPHGWDWQPPQTTSFIHIRHI